MGLAAITLVGIGTNFAVPGVYAQINFAAGPSGPASGPRNILVFGNKAAAGTATNNTVVYGPDTAVTCQTEADVIQLFGAGSHHHRMALRLWAVLGNVSPIGIYFISVTPSAGASAATTCVITGTATSVGTLRFWVVDQFVDTSINVGDTATVIGANVAASINGQFRWPVTAASVTGTITITAVVPGLEGNWIKAQAQILVPAATITTTATLTANTLLTGGTTADTVATALTTILPTRYYYIISHDSDATNNGLIATQINAQAAPTTGIRQRQFLGSADTIANEITLATGLNNPRVELQSAIGTDLTPMEIAANNAALYALFEASGSTNGPGRHNWSLFPSRPGDSNYWTLLPTRSGGSAALTLTQIQSALNNGITPLALINNGTTVQLIKRITTRSLNGAVQDYRVRDAHRVSIPDWWADDASALTTNNYGGLDLVADPQEGQPFPPNCVSPALWGGSLKSLVIQYGNAGQLKNVSAILAAMITQKEVTPPNRMSNLTPLQCIDLFDIGAILVQQVA
jgi:phage tail sheath gpL-like